MKSARPEGQALPPNILARLEAAVIARQGRKEGAEIRFLCPDHDDHDPSARYNTAKYVWWCPVCGGGGGALDLARRLALDLPEREPDGLTVAGLAGAKGLDENFLRSLGVRDGRHFGQVCIVVPYCDEAGEVRAERRRLRLTGGARFKWRKGDKTLPYGLPRLPDACSAGHVILVEGESDAWTLWQAGIPALGIPGAGTWRPEWSDYLDGIETVYAWREPDAAAGALAAKLVRDLPEVHIIEAPPDAKDPNQLWLLLSREPDAFRQRIGKLMATSQPASELRAEVLTAEAREAFEKAHYLLESPNLLESIGDAISAGGYAGDTTPAVLAYIALTSRLLERPLNLAFIAPSAAGKNRAVDAALDLMPPTAYVLVKASSPRALIYSNDDFEQRTVIIAEADSIPEDGPAASAIRSLAADNSMEYDVVEKDPETGAFTTRHVVKRGPTGIVTTSTKPLGEQMATRMLAVGITDTPDQTRSVLLAHAHSANGTLASVDQNALVAVQRWLELAGERRVVMPYSLALAEAVPVSQVRMRRDFRQFLTAIQAIALVYQRQRRTDSEGRIIATLEDYERARDLLLDVFAEAAAGGVSKTVRETADALRSIYDGKTPVTSTAVGEALGLAKDTAWHRVKRTIFLGHINNLETRKGHAAKLVPGDPLPEDRPALPTVDELNSAHQRIARSTVQPADECSIWPESERAVESAVESPIQPRPQPPPGVDLDLDTAPRHGAVERSNGNREDTHLCDDRECEATGDYRDDASGNWFCRNHGPIWATPRRGRT